MRSWLPPYFLIGVLFFHMTEAVGPPNKAPVVTGRGQTEFISLSFDGTPNEETTPMILDVLKRYNVPATFFLQSSNIKGATPLLKGIINRMFEEGHFVGIHTMDSDDLTKLKVTEVQQEVEEAENLHKEITGFRPFLIRAPFSSLSDRTREYLGAKAYVIIHYLTDLRDRSFTRSEPFLRAAEDLLPSHSDLISRMDQEYGGILLLHDIRLTAKSLSLLIEMTLRNGYTIVPLPYFMLSTERKSLFTSYRCGRDNSLLLDRMCAQLQPTYDYQKEWRPISPEALIKSKEDVHDKTSSAQTEYLYELLKEQLNREIATREENQMKIENELGQVWNTTLSRIKKTYSQLGERLDNLETRLKKHEGKLEKELETVNWNLAKDLEELIDEIETLKQDRVGDEQNRLGKLMERLQRITEKQQQQILKVEKKLQQVVNVAMGFVLIIVLLLLLASINRGWGLWQTLSGNKIDRHIV